MVCPWASEVVFSLLTVSTVDRTIQEDIAILQRLVRSGQHITACSVFHIERTPIIIYVTATTEVVYRAMNLGILPVEPVLTIAIVGILIREQLYTLGNGLVTLVLQTNGTACATCIVVCILQGDILQIEILTGIQKCSRFTDTFNSRLIHDNRTFHAFTDQ